MRKEVVRTVRFSVIIPTRNRAKQLMLTLASFERQTCPPDQFEVVVVNDGSTDDTMAHLQQYRPPYRLTVVSLNQPVGRAVARNVGVSASSEDMLIFCDADFIVFPDFIRVHEAYHVRYPDMVISGMPNLMRGAYTHFHADFSAEEKAAAAGVLRQAGLWHDAWLASPHTIDLVTPDDIRHDTGRLAQVMLPWDDGDPNWREFRATDVAPWILCVTRNLSLSRAIFDRVGGFDGIFQKYGLEDWELGYRLHAHGYKFISMAEMTGVHQEHPAAVREKEGNEENLRYFFGKHGLRNPEVSLFAVHSPEEGLPVYKNALRILLQLRRSTSARDRLAESRFRHLCTRTADRFARDPQSPAYLRDKARLQQAILAADDLFVAPVPARAKFRKIRRILSRAVADIRRADRKARLAAIRARRKGKKAGAVKAGRKGKKTAAVRIRRRGKKMVAIRSKRRSGPKAVRRALRRAVLRRKKAR